MKTSRVNLHAIVIALSLLAFLSVSAAGYLYYASSKKAAFRESDREASLYVETIKNHLALFLSENLKSVKALAGMEALKNALSNPEVHRITEANAILDHFHDALNADVCYLMSSDATTIASSNRAAPDSFVGQNYAFRPYFKKAMSGQATVYMARGITSKKRGIYCSHPVYGTDRTAPMGVVVIKAPIDPLEKEFSQTYRGTLALVDPHGLAFLSNRKDWLYHFLWKPSPQDISEISQGRQFGRGPWHWTGLGMKDDTHAENLSGEAYVVYRTDVETYPGWQVVYLQSVKEISKRVSVSLLKMTGLVILTVCVFIGLLILFLYRKASLLIAQRRAAEEALRESEKTALALLNAPTESALLLDTHGTILALNKPAAERFGKSAQELNGSNAFEQFPAGIAKARRAYHEWVVRSGKPFRYEDNREGRWLNTNVYPVFDAKGQVSRVAIFSHDVTDQKNAEEELRVAKEKLTQYSKGLERRVKKRTREITSILKYTPAVVFIKNEEMQYTLVNSKFEELFGLTNEDIQGKTDYDIFPKESADQFRKSDLQVLTEGRACQVEEVVSQNHGLHTYLSTKFPLYDENGSVSGLCGIATDITALKKAQDQLRRLSGSIITGQEKERRVIARELHDELGQMLTALRIDSVWIWERLKEQDKQAAERALSMMHLIDKSIDEVRSMATRLRPGVLDDLGLIPALEWYTTDFEKRTGIDCRFKHSNVDRVNNILATAAYRIAQEALTNVARHSQAIQVDVTLQRSNGILTLAVIDNGRGFDAQDMMGSDCLGIAGMRERAGLVGGSLEIRSEPQEGTAVFFKVPIHDQNGDRS